MFIRAVLPSGVTGNFLQVMTTGSIVQPVSTPQFFVELPGSSVSSIDSSIYFKHRISSIVFQALYFKHCKGAL
jgi:hypothetical protein